MTAVVKTWQREVDGFISSSCTAPPRRASISAIYWHISDHESKQLVNQRAVITKWQKKVKARIGIADITISACTTGHVPSDRSPSLEKCRGHAVR